MSGPESTPSKGMGRTTIVLVVVVIIIIALVGYYLVSGTGSNNTTGTTTPNIHPVSVNIASGTGASNGALNFNPATFKVVVGVNNTITWTNADSVPHTITFTSAPSGVSTSSLTDPNNLNAGGTYTVTLTTPGTYQFHCTIHSWMHGTITVSMAA